MVVSLGRCAQYGSSLLRENPTLGHPGICVDAEALIHRGEWCSHGGPDGRHPDTQRRLREHPNCQKCCREIQAKVVTLPVTVVKCKWGKHRSVGCLEMAIDDLQKCRSVADVDMHILHIDRDGVDTATWQYLSEV